MASRVKGIVVEIGGDTVGLDKALDSTNKRINSTQSALKDVERMLKLDPKNVTLLERKQRLLAEATEETRNKLAALEDANKKVSESVKNYDAWKAAYDPIKSQIDSTSEKIKKLKSQQAEMAECGEVDSDAYRRLTEEIQTTSAALRDLKSQAKKVGDEFGNPVSPEQYISIQREIVETKTKLSELENSAKRASSGLDQITITIKDTQAELKEVNRALEKNSKNTVLLEQKQELLAQAISETEKALEIMEDEYDEMMGNAYAGVAENEKAFRKLERQIEETKATLKDLKEESRKTENAIDGIDEKPIRDVDDAADDAKGSLKDAGDEASTFGDMLKAQLSADAIKEVGEALKDVAEDSKEYRKIMGSLEISSEKAGYTAEQTSEAYKKLYGVLGDEQSAATTLANLQAIGLSQDELLGLVDSLVGAWAQYGDSIPIDGLAEAVNETIKTGQVTGVLADVLNWGAEAGETYGVAMKAATEENEAWNKSVADAQTAEDYFNLSLQGCTDEAERANRVLQMLADQGLANSGQAWQENNQSLVESNQAQAAMQEQLAQLGEMVEPIFTKITNAVVAALGWFNSLDSGIQNTILVIGGIAMAMAMLSPIVTGLGTVFSSLSGVLTFLAANPIMLVIAAVAAIVAIFITLWNKCEWFRNLWIGLWEGIKSAAKAAWDFIDSKVIQPIADAMTNLWDNIKSGVNGFMRGIESFFNGIIGGINWLIRAMNKISFDVPDWVPGIGGKTFGFNISEIGKVNLPQLATGGEVLRGSAIVGEAGPELLTVAPGRTIVQPLSGNTTNHNSTNLGGVNIVVYGAPGQDVRALAGIIMEEMQYAYDSKAVAL